MHKGKCCTQLHFIGKVDGPISQKGFNFFGCSDQGRQNRVYRLAALLHLLKKQFINIKNRSETGRAKYDHNAIDLFKGMLTIINAFPKLFCIAGSQHINGI